MVEFYKLKHNGTGLFFANFKYRHRGNRVACYSKHGSLIDPKNLSWIIELFYETKCQVELDDLELIAYEIAPAKSQQKLSTVRKRVEQKILFRRIKGST